MEAETEPSDAVSRRNQLAARSTSDHDLDRFELEEIYLDLWQELPHSPDDLPADLASSPIVESMLDVLTCMVLVNPSDPAPWQNLGSLQETIGDERGAALSLGRAAQLLRASGDEDDASDAEVNETLATDAALTERQVLVALATSRHLPPAERAEVVRKVREILADLGEV